MLLGIESSCDDSSLALVDLQTAKLLWHSKISQESAHSPYGGVVPELASRLHALNLPLLAQRAKDFLNGFGALKAIAITTCPGLSVTLLEGLMLAKTLALGLNIPLIAIDHLQAHIFSLFIDKPPIFPLSVLLVSGGHTLIVEAHGPQEMQIVAKSLDDSLGESFDKVSKMLGLSYPGGPVVESLAKACPPQEELKFTLPLKDHKGLAFSFSGLKNATRLAIMQEKEQGAVSESFKARLCAGFQKTATAHLLQNLRRYFANSPIKTLGLVGGVSANLYVREHINALCNEFGRDLLLAPLEFCSDNAAMVARAGVELFRCKDFSTLYDTDISPHTRLVYAPKFLL
ncbi:putative DNA-binding/iron metalloprotein/AP endonuclease Gcp [Helicobacter ailurogastricus]|uniref:tRNA (adenosine(37)-N6)-threonylcarbamoyltransferase complex transferase subunit TsaD n=1 Tax=Helicobacter ailurogastricus TaxID=1578720 RepID=UPI00244D8D6B|nr:tRNA (adenosine(37)-N6)-threonylcarbamoyltransferase complex transferase subunit TsaD [Helicobacter ailurogastricus]GMB89791.1 putative DNA-binding/iron metalloprotein/AP endonuclease Gcp [Helicobacter ailurogastricus]